MRMKIPIHFGTIEKKLDAIAGGATTRAGPVDFTSVYSIIDDVEAGADDGC